MHVGIENSNEFYTHHYLTATVAADLKSAVFDIRQVEGDDEVAPRQPWSDLRGVRQSRERGEVSHRRRTCIQTSET